MRGVDFGRLFKLGAQIVLPDVCAGCNRSGAWICEECWPAVRLVDQSRACPACGFPRTGTSPGCRRCDDWAGIQVEIRSVFVFSDAVRQSILRMKYHGEYARAGWHGGQIAELARSIGWQADILVPVPLHRRQLRRRGFNQSEKLAAAVGAILSIEVQPVLRRVRDTPSQTSLPATGRQSNILGAFECDASLDGCSVVLIDDVVTTGSTLLECARVCREAGAVEVRALTVAADI